MKIIIGLGNPLPKYKGTRHNIGQMIISRFQEINNFPKFQLKKKLESLISEGKIGEEKIILALPQTFMNESGRAVKKIILNQSTKQSFVLGRAYKDMCSGLKSKILNLIVVHDDIDLPLGKIRIKTDGSSGGHNGVQSIIDYFKIRDFVRIKIGVANEKRGLVPAEKFVLEKFGKEEKETLDKIIKKSVEVINNYLANKNIKPQTFFLENK